MEKVILIAASALLLGGGLAPKVEWAPKEYPISFWCGPPDKFITPERFRQIADAGFNYAMPPCEGPFTSDVNHRILDSARAAGIKAFIFDEGLPLKISGVPDARKRLDAIVRDYAKHPALAGYFLTDEPNANAFEGLGEVVAYLRQKDPEHAAYINLFPNYASPEQLGTPTYDEYVDRFIKTVHPFAVSYDHYHFLKDGDRPGFFANLDTVRRISTEAGLPFWQIVLSIPHLSYRSLTEAEKRWEAMQTLACGGKGLMYFTYWTPTPNESDWKPAIIAHDGNPTPQYEEVKRINGDVRAIGKYLLNAVFVTVFQNGNLAPGGTPREQGTPVSFPGAGDVTTGLFRADTHLYVLFANRDYRKATQADVLLSAGARPVQRLDKATGRWLGVKTERSPDGDLKVQLDLAPGDGELYRW